MAVDFDTLVTGPAMRTFGVPVTYYPFAQAIGYAGALVFDEEGEPVGTHGPGYGATGVFDKAYLDMTPAGDGPFPGTEGFEFGAPGSITEATPVLGVQPSRMKSEPAQYDQVDVAGTRYVVKSAQPDGHGWVLLILNLV
ncbi:hypothetical protein FGG78_35160 [Thioclava sp. BHET1]|nr:hypothetical protein FGG78_35160 [Thioclava sp. BHET1]